MENSKTPSYETAEFVWEEHRSFYQSFKRYITWCSGLTILMILALTLIFAASVNWIFSLMASFVVGLALGVFMKMEASWYVTLFVLLMLSFMTGLCVMIFRIML